MQGGQAIGFCTGFRDLSETLPISYCEPSTSRCMPWSSPRCRGHRNGAAAPGLCSLLHTRGTGARPAEAPQADRQPPSPDICHLPSTSTSQTSSAQLGHLWVLGAGASCSPPRADAVPEGCCCCWAARALLSHLEWAPSVWSGQTTQAAFTAAGLCVPIPSGLRQRAVG